MRDYSIELKAPTLHQFYLEYAEWLDKGAPTGGTFHRCGGLCSNLYGWVDKNFGNQALRNSLLEELHEQFKEAGLHSIIPFNNVSPYLPPTAFFTDEASEGACHLNPHRVQWVHNHLEDN